MKTFSAFTASDKLLGPVWNGSFSVGISKEDRSYGLHTSYIVWNGGIHLPVPEKRNRFLHRARELKHPIRAKSFRGCSSSGRQSASIFFFISDQAPSCCLLDPVGCSLPRPLRHAPREDYGWRDRIDWLVWREASLGVKHIEKNAGEGKRWMIG